MGSFTLKSAITQDNYISFCLQDKKESFTGFEIEKSFAQLCKSRSVPHHPYKLKPRIIPQKNNSDLGFAVHLFKTCWMFLYPFSWLQIYQLKHTVYPLKYTHTNIHTCQQNWVSHYYKQNWCFIVSPYLILFLIHRSSTKWSEVSQAW